MRIQVCRTYRTITQKCLQLELPTENSVYSQENRNRAGNYAHLTSENGKLAAFASGRPAFQQHVKRTEGRVIPPPPRTFRKYCAQSEKTATSPSCKQITQPSGLRRLGTATRMSASLFRGSLRSSRAPSTKAQKRQSLPF